jgi:tetratricopeptide (TPR) repeat protein
MFMVIASSPALGVGQRTENQYLDGIKKFAGNKDGSSARKLSAEFFKTYPKTRYIPDVKLILADAESSPTKAIPQYKSILKNFRYFNKNDYVQYRICEINYLMSNWPELKIESQNGGKKFPKSRFMNNFSMFLVFSLMQLGDYEGAEHECRKLVGNNHDYNNLAAALLILASIQKKSSGLSKQYIGSIREIARGFSESDAMPAALFFMGEFYEQKKLHDESYSAYSDLIAKYPGSPEATEGNMRVNFLIKYNPKRVTYLPGKKIIDAADSIDISPEIEIPENSHSMFFYSISIGPFSSLKSAEEIKKLLDEYDFIKTVRLKNGYTLYVSRSPDEESILKVKIRLAEEHGLNGRIVRISSDGKNSYMYGE